MSHSNSPATQLLLVFLKEPREGEVKTRIARDSGEDQACLYYKAMVQVLLQQLEGLNNTDIHFYFSPDDAEEAVPFWILPQLRGNVMKQNRGYLFTPEKSAPSQQIEFRPQGQGNLGERLQRAFHNGFQEGYKKVAIIGTDCPDCGARWIQAALTMLKQENQCVIGPSHDGGYYLLALKKEHKELFQNIDWSSEIVLEQTLQLAKNLSLSTALLPPLKDIDHLEDWEKALESPIGGKLKAALKKITLQQGHN